MSDWWSIMHSKLIWFNQGSQKKAHYINVIEKGLVFIMSCNSFSTYINCFDTNLIKYTIKMLWQKLYINLVQSCNHIKESMMRDTSKCYFHSAVRYFHIWRNHPKFNKWAMLLIDHINTSYGWLHIATDIVCCAIL